MKANNELKDMVTTFRINKEIYTKFKGVLAKRGETVSGNLINYIKSVVESDEKETAGITSKEIITSEQINELKTMLKRQQEDIKFLQESFRVLGSCYLLKADSERNSN